jgi:hypothetical protein
MKKLIVIIVLLLVAGAVFGQEFTFRGHQWGASVESIIAKEGRPDSNTHGQLIYQNKKVAGYNAALQFNCGTPYSEEYGLWIAQYTIGVTNTDSLAVYNDLYNKLSALYGRPTPGACRT